MEGRLFLIKQGKHPKGQNLTALITSWNYFFFPVGKEIQDRDIQQVLGICWGQLFLQKVKKTIKGVAILDPLCRHELAESGRGFR